MLVKRIPAFCWNISVKRCGVPPSDDTAMLSLPGRAFARSTSSATVRAGTDGWTSSRFGTSATTTIGTRSRAGAYGSFGYSATAVVIGPNVPCSSV